MWGWWLVLSEREGGHSFPCSNARNVLWFWRVCVGCERWWCSTMCAFLNLKMEGRDMQGFQEFKSK